MSEGIPAVGECGQVDVKTDLTDMNKQCKIYMARSKPVLFKKAAAEWPCATKWCASKSPLEFCTWVGLNGERNTPSTMRPSTMRLSTMRPSTMRPWRAGGWTGSGSHPWAMS